MIEINFYPECDNHLSIQAAKEYTAIWLDYGEQIIDSYWRISGYDFSESVINAIVFEGISQSVPMHLRASLSKEMKQATLVHELGHRLIVGNNLNFSIDKTIQSLENHKQLDLILFDVWESLFGNKLALEFVSQESKRPLYKEAWDWALVIDKKDRLARFIHHFDQFKQL